jgi:hypothetical protein
MPPHCDSLDGPVVRAAAHALDGGDVDLILPYVAADAEDELGDAFDLAIKARTLGAAAAQVADRYFYETAVRLHRAGEGAPYTGLKPAGLDVGPVIPLAEHAIDTSDPTELADFLTAAVRTETLARFAAMNAAKLSAADDGVAVARAYVQAALGLQVWAHKLYGAVHAPAHESAPYERVSIANRQLHRLSGIPTS